MSEEAYESGARIDVMLTALEYFVSGESVKPLHLTSDERQIVECAIQQREPKRVAALRARAAELFMELERRRIAK